MRKPNPGDFIWDDAAIERLKELWAEGHVASEIGKTFGVSKNAILGKLHRLGLANTRPDWRKKSPAHLIRIEQPLSKSARPRPKLHTKRETAAQPPKIPQMRTNKRPLPPPEPYQAPPPPPSPPIGSFDLLELRSGQCRWPEGDRVPFRFCGMPVEDGSYCAAHAALCYPPRKHAAAA